MHKDLILKKLTETYPKPAWTDRSAFLFEDLIKTIISQQLSIKAAEHIYKRFNALFETPTPSPEKILSIEQGSIRQIGVSVAKAHYIHNVAQAFVNKDLEIKKITTMPDEEIIEALTKIKGVGRWTAEMILIFTLNRPNIFSYGDLGLKNAIKNLYGITEKNEILKLTETWSPNKSLASWYLWKSLENK